MIIGGNCDGSASSLISKYTIDQWERVGNLQDSRRYHRAIANDDRIYVVGGEGQRYVFFLNIRSKILFFSVKLKSGRSIIMTIPST